MLINVISDSIQSINDYKTAQNLQISAKKFNATLAKLNMASIALRETLDIAEEIYKQGIASAPIVDRSIQKTLLKSIDDCGQELEQLSLSDARIAELNSQTMMLKKVITHNWQINSNLRAQNLANYLGLIENLVADAQTAKSLRIKLTDAIGKVPEKKKDIHAFVAAVNSAQTLVDTLKVDEKVRDFLVKVALKQATLDDLNQHVQKWITDNCLTKKIHITF